MLRYGFFYGPGTWYNPDGAAADALRQRLTPLIGEGQGVWSYVHIEDAAMATVSAIGAKPGIYNIVDDDPSPIAVWLPRFANFVGAPSPPRITEEQARKAVGKDAVYYATKLRGTSNKKARGTLNFRPRRLEWL
jgi:nucleoside-diphosphate-sugar epimerase